MTEPASSPAESATLWLRNVVAQLDAVKSVGDRIVDPRLISYAMIVRIRNGDAVLDPDLRDAVLLDQLRALLDERDELAAENERLRARAEGPVITAVRVVGIEAAGEYWIGSDSIDDSGHWAYVVHDHCGLDVWTGRHKPTNTDMATLLSYMATHHCGAGAVGTEGRTC